MSDRPDPTSPSFDSSEKADPRKSWTSKLAIGNSDDIDLETNSDMDEVMTLRQRLRVLEEKVFGNNRIIMEEEQKVAEIGQLAGKITSNQNGSIKKTVLALVCDCCWQPMDGPPAICPVDKKKVHSKCMISFEQKPMCRECLMKKIPLDKAAYKILMFAGYRIDSKKVINEFTKITKDNINFYVEIMGSFGYLSRGWLGGFQITDMGINIMTAYKQIYGTEEDVIKLERELSAGLGLL